MCRKGGSGGQESVRNERGVVVDILTNSTLNDAINSSVISNLSFACL